MEAFLLWALFGAVVGIIAAGKRGFHPAIGMFGGMMLGLFSILLFLVNGSVTTKKCPMCAESVRSEALKCKHCGHVLGSAPTA